MRAELDLTRLGCAEAKTSCDHSFSPLQPEAHSLPVSMRVLGARFANSPERGLETESDNGRERSKPFLLQLPFEKNCKQEHLCEGDLGISFNFSG